MPRTVDGAEFAVRAVLGQQVSTAGGPHDDRRAGGRPRRPGRRPGRWTHPPLPDPRAHWRTPSRPCRPPVGAPWPPLVDALASGRLDVGPGADRDRSRAALAALPGVGPWTVEMVAMRALGDPDAFPPPTSGVRRAADALGLPAAPAALRARVRGVAPVAGLRRPAPVGGDRPPGQPLAAATPPEPARPTDRPLTGRRAAAAQKEPTHA